MDTHNGDDRQTTHFDGPLFIIGMPRSGTKLLRSLLNQNPRISIARNETEFLPYLVTRWERFGDLSDIAKFHEFYRIIQKFPYLQTGAARANRIGRDEWYNNCERFDVAGVFEALLRRDTHAPPGSGIIWGDKSPGYIGKIPMLRTLYPNAKLVHIVRDVRDHCSSMRNAWGKNIYRAAQRWADDVALAQKHGRTADGYFEIQYEDLLRDPEAKLAELCKFIDVEYLPEMTKLKKPSEKIGDAKNQAFIVKDNFEKYRKTLTAREILSIESIAAPTMRAAGYNVGPATATTRLPNWQMQVFRGIDAFNLMVRGIHRLGARRAFQQYLRTFIVSPNRID